MDQSLLRYQWSPGGVFSVGGTEYGVAFPDCDEETGKVIRFVFRPTSNQSLVAEAERLVDLKGKVQELYKRMYALPKFKRQQEKLKKEQEKAIAQ